MFSAAYGGGAVVCGRVHLPIVCVCVVQLPVGLVCSGAFFFGGERVDSLLSECVCLHVVCVCVCACVFMCVHVCVHMCV